MMMMRRSRTQNVIANTRLSGNKVNSAALTKMSTALSTWRSAVKRMIDKGDSYEKIKAKYPLMTKMSTRSSRSRARAAQPPNQVSGAKKCGS